MKKVTFKVICQYGTNTYTIKAEDAGYERFNYTATSLGDCMTHVYQITRTIRQEGAKAVFVFE